VNRRGFLGVLLGFAVLPGATTYKRIWKATEAGVLTPMVTEPGVIIHAGTEAQLIRFYAYANEDGTITFSSEPGASYCVGTLLESK
jgi:hypothetical protein